jgi:hypothetical protein
VDPHVDLRGCCAAAGEQVDRVCSLRLGGDGVFCRPSHHPRVRRLPSVCDRSTAGRLDASRKMHERVVAPVFAQADVEDGEVHACSRRRRIVIVLVAGGVEERPAGDELLDRDRLVRGRFDEVRDSYGHRVLVHEQPEGQVMWPRVDDQAPQRRVSLCVDAQKEQIAYPLAPEMPLCQLPQRLTPRTAGLLAEGGEVMSREVAVAGPRVWFAYDPSGRSTLVAREAAPRSQSTSACWSATRSGNVREFPSSADRCRMGEG